MNIIEYRSACVPVYYLRGVVPPIFSLDAEQQGIYHALLLEREEARALLPFEAVSMNVEGQIWQGEPPHSADIHNALAQLERDGWTLCGRITLTKETI